MHRTRYRAPVMRAVSHIKIIDMKKFNMIFRFADSCDADNLHKNLFASKSLTKIAQNLLSDIEMMKQGKMIRIVGEYKDEPRLIHEALPSDDGRQAEISRNPRLWPSRAISP